jgi:hypothetical protein
LHAKIRISLVALRDIAIRAVDLLVQAKIPKLALAYETRVARPTDYLRELHADADAAGPVVARRLQRQLAVPRYLGIVSLRGSKVGVADVHVDTTSTKKNLSILAVVHRGLRSGRAHVVRLARAYRTAFVDRDGFEAF